MVDLVIWHLLSGTDFCFFLQQFANIREAVSILRQVAGALASAECQYCFEHRDLHWGNVLVRKSKRSKVSFKVEGDVFDVSSFRVEASIIDFTLSRLSKGRERSFPSQSIKIQSFQFHVLASLRKSCDKMVKLYDGYKMGRLVCPVYRRTGGQCAAGLTADGQILVAYGKVEKIL